MSFVRCNTVLAIVQISPIQVLSATFTPKKSKMTPSFIAGNIGVNKSTTSRKFARNTGKQNLNNQPRKNLNY